MRKMYHIYHIILLNDINIFFSQDEKLNKIMQTSEIKCVKQTATIYVYHICEERFILNVYNFF